MKSHNMWRDEIKTIVFDFGGTLYEISNGIIDIWKRYFESENAHFDKRKFFSGLVAARQYLDNKMVKRIVSSKNPIFKQDDWLHYNNIIIDAMDINPHNLEHFNRLITIELSKIEYKYEIIQDIKKSLSILYDKYTLAILSNISYDIRKYLIKDNIIDYFDFIGLSYELGAWKPDPSIFRICCNKLSVHPSNMLFIGDSLLCDIKASSDFGMNSLHIDYHNTNPNMIKINKLGELVSLLDV